MSNHCITQSITFSRAKGAARLLQFIIANSINPDDDWTYRNVRKLAEECECTPRYVRMLILKQIGAGELIGRLKDVDGGTWHEFYVPIYKGEEGYDPQPCEDDGETHICNGYHTPIWVSRHKMQSEKGRQARAADRAARATVAKRGRVSIHTPPHNEQSYPQIGNDSSGVGGNDSSHPGNDSSHPGNDSSHPGNGSAELYRKNQLKPTMNQIEPSLAREEEKSLSNAELREWAKSSDGAAYITARGQHPALCTIPDLRLYHARWLKAPARAAKGGAK